MVFPERIKIFDQTTVAPVDEFYWNGQRLLEGDVNGIAADWGMSFHPSSRRLVFGGHSTNDLLKSRPLEPNEWHSVCLTVQMNKSGAQYNATLVII